MFLVDQSGLQGRLKHIVSLQMEQSVVESVMVWADMKEIQKRIGINNEAPMTGC